MTREEALLKLLAVEPETRSRLIVITGWPSEETNAVLDRLLRQRKVTFSNWSCVIGRRRYFPVQA